jgi:hypothetical protein
VIRSRDSHICTAGFDCSREDKERVGKKRRKKTKRLQGGSRGAGWEDRGQGGERDGIKSLYGCPSTVRQRGKIFCEVRLNEGGMNARNEAKGEGDEGEGRNAATHV